jgi:hypothetical protein
MAAENEAEKVEAQTQPLKQQPAAEGHIDLVLRSEDALPFKLNSVFISLRLPIGAFKKDVGGTAES